MRKRIIIIGLVLIAAACGEDIVLDDSPSIELVSIGPSTVVELQDSIQIVIRYEDGDGDLGENTPDAKNYYLVDERIDLEYRFRIRELVPNSASVPIAGTLVLTLPNTVITNGSTSEELTYSIWIVDRAGNQSNTVTAGPITVVSP